MITLENAQNALKTVYLEALSNQLNTAVDPVFAMVKQSSADVYGRNIVKLVPYGLNGGIGAGDEAGQLPESCDDKYTTLSTNLKNLYGTIEITDKAIRASSNDEGAFVDLLSSEMEGLLQASKFNLSRMFYGDGTGKLGGEITEITPASKSMKITNITCFMEGMIVDFYMNDLLDPAMWGVEIVKVDRENNVVYLDKVSSNFTAANKANYTVSIQGSRDKELTGLGTIFGNSETLYGIKRADYHYLMPYKTTKGSNVTLSETVIQTWVDALEKRSTYQPNVILCGGNVLYDIIELLSSSTKNLDTANLNGGYNSFTFNGIPVLRNRFEIANVIQLINTNVFTLHQLCDWEWLANNDGSILKQKEGYPTYTATLVKYADLICDRPNAQGLITLL